MLERRNNKEYIQKHTKDYAMALVAGPGNLLELCLVG